MPIVDILLLILLAPLAFGVGLVFMILAVLAILIVAEKMKSKGEKS